MPDQPYLLYGAYASYYTAKVRCYLRTSFAERLPSDPTFHDGASHVRQSPYSQILAPNGEVIQDSVAIVDALEKVFPTYRLIRHSCQRLFVHLMWNSSTARIDPRLEASLALRGKHPFHARDFGRTSNRKAMTKR